MLLWKEQQKEQTARLFQSCFQIPEMGWTENTDSHPDKSVEVQAVTALYHSRVQKSK